MADDMAENGSDARHYQTATEAALGERVTNLGRRLADNEQETRNQISGLNATLTSFMNETRTSLSSIAATIASGGKPNFQALSVMLAALLAVGALVYWPIREGQTRIDNALAAIGDKMVTRQEMDWRSARGQEDRIRQENAVADIRTAMLPRNEWTERNLARDHDIQNIRASIEREVANIQRQLDLQRADFQTFSNSLGNGRDVIQDLKSELDRLRERLGEIQARQYQRLGAAPPP